MPDQPTPSEIRTESDLVAAWIADLKRHERLMERWTLYPETAGWDLVMVHSTGAQIGIEAKLTLNAKVIDQALSHQHTRWSCDGPDWRAVLVPEGKTQLHLRNICAAIGLEVLTYRKPQQGVSYHIRLPDPDTNYGFNDWPNWCPSKRLILPEYVPDVSAGCAAPVMLTPWKIQAIKLMIVLERRGYVTRADMRALKISPTRWCDHFHGFLTPGPGRQYLRGPRTPDFKAQHPVNWAQIEADIETWGQELGLFDAAVQGGLL